MKPLLLFCVALLLTIQSFSQEEVKAGQLKEHLGDTVKFCGKVFSARLMDRSERRPTFLNIDGAYPNQVLTVVIWGSDRERFKHAPEKFYTGKLVCIIGKVEKYKEQLQIVVRSEEQLSVME